MKPSNDPLIRVMNKTRRESAVGQLQDLLAIERRWKSKETLASNKLRAVRFKISALALQLCRENDCDEKGIRGNILKRASQDFKGGAE